ncbi:MAG: dTDP-4-dehydrorhamnose reductase [Clostridia bacterium]|nr:dTDP-4-dehydrorhamnose reductase [Clostridia bacterium]
MKILVTGAHGQVGQDMMSVLKARGHNVTGTDLVPGNESDSIIPLDITDPEAVRQLLMSEQPDAVIHCAAWTAVDAAEDPENREKVYAVNADGTRNIAFVCRELDCKMLYLSTDYVFDGTGETPWQPDETRFAPLNIYGQSKLAGEDAVRSLLKRYFIVRISWVFGPGTNFVKTMLRVAGTHNVLRVINDQIGTPTYAPDLVRLLADLIESEQYGVYNASNEGGYISWYDFACEIFRQAGIEVTVLPVSTAEYGQSKALRPLNSRLDKSKLRQCGFTPLPDWRDALTRYLGTLS